MGWFDRFRNRGSPPVTKQTITSEQVIAKDQLANTYDNRNITFTGELATYDYETILRDKQANITQLYELADYFIDADPIVRGIIKGVYATFAVTPWKLIGESEKIKQKYEDYYERIHLRDRMTSILYQYFKYGNVYVYLQPDGNIISLPVNKTRISNIMINGEPLLEFDAQSIRNDIFYQGIPARKGFIDDEEIDIKVLGLPEEVQEAVIKSDAQWVQLNPENTFVLQDLKEDWMRYAVPMIAAFLDGLKKKRLISNYEDALLNLGINSFIHVRYGNDNAEAFDMYPNQEELSAVNSVFMKAMKGSALAVTNNYAQASVIQPDTKFLFEFDKYKNANAEILSAGGISGIIVSGRAEDGSSFASAQVSINTADKRIEHARANFCEMMNKINQRVNDNGILPRSAGDKVPRFSMLPLDLSGTSKFQRTCVELYKMGCVSTQTMMEAQGFDMGQEIERKKKEIKSGDYELLNNLYVQNDLLSKKNQEQISKSPPPPQNINPQNRNPQIQETEIEEEMRTETKKVGRPEIQDEDRTSDKGNSFTGKQPKPSNPEGSLGDNG